MHTIPLHLKQNPYSIVIGDKILGRLGQKLSGMKIGEDAVVITNPVIARHHGRKLATGLKKYGFSVKVFTVPGGEKSKSAGVAMELIAKLSKYDVKRKPFIIAFGGGVVGDLAGFVAAIYKRGIPYVQVPTTLLAQIDSAIGGKTAIDLPTGKNLVGAFYQPRLVWSDVSVLKTLNLRQIRNGLAEAVKYGVIRDPGLFAYIERNTEKLLKNDSAAMVHVVKECSAIKAKVCVADEKETKGIRTILNFGHTLGHAIEADAKYDQYHHGEAIALGMRAASDISVRMKLFNKVQASRLEKLLTRVGLPREIKNVRIAKILDIMQHDKKFSGKKNRFVLALRLGRVKVVENIPEKLIRESLRALTAV